MFPKLTVCDSGSHPRRVFPLEAAFGVEFRDYDHNGHIFHARDHGAPRQTRSLFINREAVPMRELAQRLEVCRVCRIFLVELLARDVTSLHSRVIDSSKATHPAIDLP